MSVAGATVVPADQGGHVEDVAILCEFCYENGNFDTMWPGDGEDHANHPVWGIAVVKVANDDGDWDLKWRARGLTLAQAEERLNGMDFDGPFHLMG